jgi:hypothetical protein
VFQSDGHNPIDVGAFRSEAPQSAAARPRPRLRLSRVRGPQPPAQPGPPSLPKRAREPKAAKEPKVREKDEPPPIDTPPPGAWPPGAVPGQVSLPASIAYVVWRAVVIAAIAAFYLVRFVFQLAVRPFLHMLG